MSTATADPLVVERRRPTTFAELLEVHDTMRAVLGGDPEAFDSPEAFINHQEQQPVTATPDFDIENAVIHAIDDYVIAAADDEENCLGDDELRLMAITDPGNRDLIVRWLVADGFLVPAAAAAGAGGETYSIGTRSVRAEYQGVDVS
jgi:hypothetical protein